jgi:hypothetical protein
LAERILTILVYTNFKKVKNLLLSFLSLRVRLRRSLGLAERFIKNSEELAELFPDIVGNLRVCFGFTSNCSASRNDRFLYKSFVVIDSISKR